MAMLSDLPPNVLERAWPPESYFMGLRVCKELRRSLIESAAPVTLQIKTLHATDAALADRRMAVLAQHKTDITVQNSAVFHDHGQFSMLMRIIRTVHVTGLYMRNCSISTHELVIFPDTMPFLRKLDLGSNYIHEHSMPKLSQGLRGCTKLQLLDLSGNTLSFNSPAMFTELTAALSVCSELTCLDLSYNGMRIEHAQPSTLSTCRGLELLALEGNYLTSRGTEILSGCTNLKCLNLGVNKLGSYGATRLSWTLAACTQLTSLDLSENGITENDTAGALVCALTRLTTLTCLNLSVNSISPGGIEALTQAMSSLTRLDA